MSKLPSRHVIVGLALTLPLLAVSAGAASEDGAATGTNFSLPASALITVATGLLLTLLLKPTLVAAYRSVSGSLGRRRLRRMLASSGIAAMHDFILPGAYDGLAHVDHAVLVPGGVVCILHKDYCGAVFGAAEDSQWSYVDGPKRRRFLNPVIQNEGRVSALCKAVPDLPVIGLVVFSDGADFATARPDNVIHLRELTDWLDKLIFVGGECEDTDTAWLRLQAAALTDEKSRKDFDAQLSFG